MSQLEEMKGRAEKASPGPWDASIAATADGEELATTLEQKASFLALSLNKEGSNLWLVDNGGVIPAATGDGPNAKLNAEFIAHARTDVPKLIAALEAVENVGPYLEHEYPSARDSAVAEGWNHARLVIHKAITEAL